MKKRKITAVLIKAFEDYLTEQEKSKATKEKYIRDIMRFVNYLSDRALDKTILLNYKALLRERYALSSANSIIAALNSFLRFAGWEDFRIKQFKVQRQTFSSFEKELTKQEYFRLVEAAKKKSNDRLSLLVQCMCSTGIRVSEVQFITVEAAKKGMASVLCKGKSRMIFIVSSLKKKLLQYAKAHHIKSGSIFITKNGNPMNRSNIWREMKSLCKSADVLPNKVFPHNLRHLFAKTFYEIEKDIAKLADILGHASINTTRIYITTTGIEHLRKMENMRLIL